MLIKLKDPIRARYIKNLESFSAYHNGQQPNYEARTQALIAAIKNQKPSWCF